MQTVSIFLSSNENPEKADVNITGKDKSTAAKTGTESEPSQKRTIKITETSGTERINASGISKRIFKTENFVHKKPNKIPRKDEIKNAQKTLKKVKAKDLRKFFSTAREKKSAATDSGEGRTKGESITSEKNFQSKKKNAIEKTKIFFLFKIKSAVWKFSANRSRLKFHKHRKQFFNFVSCIISCFKNKGAFWNCFFYNSRI